MDAWARPAPTPRPRPAVLSSPFGVYFFGLCCQSLSGPGNASVTTTHVGVPDRRDRSGEIWGCQQACFRPGDRGGLTQEVTRAEARVTKSQLASTLGWGWRRAWAGVNATRPQRGHLGVPCCAVM